MNFNSFFPTIIGSANNENNDDIAEELMNYCIEISKKVAQGGKSWLSNRTYNTSDGKYDILKDSTFSEVNTWVEKQVKLYCTELSIDNSSLQSSGAWFNLYKKHDFQEPHVHPNSSISAIYVLTCPKNGARIFFNSPVNNMYYVKKTVEKQEMADQIICSSVPGSLLIFPSYLNHAVELHDSNELRVTFSYNYRN